MTASHLTWWILVDFVWRIGIRSSLNLRLTKIYKTKRVMDSCKGAPFMLYLQLDTSSCSQFMQEKRTTTSGLIRAAGARTWHRQCQKPRG